MKFISLTSFWKKIMTPNGKTFQLDSLVFHSRTYIKKFINDLYIGKKKT